MPTTPPQPLPRWDYTAQDISDLAKRGIDAYKIVVDRVGALDTKDCTFQSVALEDGRTKFTELKELVDLTKSVSPSKEVREAADQAETLLNDFDVEASTRVDVFKAKLAAEKNIKEAGLWDQLSSEERRLVDKMVWRLFGYRCGRLSRSHAERFTQILDGKRLGLGLPAEKVAKLTSLKKELSQVISEYEKNCNEEDGFIVLSESELKGVPDEELASSEKFSEGENAGYKITYRGFDIFSVFGYAEDPSVRKKVYESWQSRQEKSVPLFNRAMELRHKIASLLGYKTWADYVTEVKMAKTGKTVEDFLDDLEDKLKPLGIKELEGLRELKKKEHEEKGLPFDGKFYIWDHNYYRKKFFKHTLNLDGAEIKKYFPVSAVVPAVLSVYNHILSLRFEEVKGASVWHPDVQVFSVWETDVEGDAGFVGYFYLDLYPRPGKFTHNAVWPVLQGYELPDKKRAYPIIVMVANLAKPTPERPALMGHQEVWTFFHEMGHIFHHLLSRTKFARFHGLNVTSDFGEAPSQMLENWCWEPQVLKKLSSHFETQKPLSPDLIDKLIKSRYSLTGLFYLQQVFFAKFDLVVHILPVQDDYAHLWNSLRKKVYLHEYDKETPGHATFQHLLGGDGVGYYGYTWSQSFAADMYKTAFKADSLNPAWGRRYRDIVLLPGGSRDEMEILKVFQFHLPTDCTDGIK
ncbi:hypothetical protein CVT26_006011 [Gymnopilus dilepis]|uniref:Peptidase M3A/M3B catalytic domain-containing protein n=1 Tax=Gymnopilus dilepis TaxID=231916 RepID=A0A409Y1G4_9AGAR|nr:hypothetical protein CVT26_006011 [Gymnopilus dilepis]